jgi:hypothetical protein
MGRTASWVWASGLLLLACKGKKTEIVPEQVTVKYCAHTVQVRDVERCVFELTPEQQRKRAWTQRLTYRDTRVVRREFVSGSGTLINNDVEDYQYAGGRVSVVLHSSRNGVPLGRETLSADGATVQFVDEQGRPKSHKDEHVPGLRREFDGAGLVQSTRYVDIAGNPLGQGDAYEERDKHDANGLVTERAFFGRDGEPVEVRCAHRTVYEPDERGELRSETIFDDKGQPALCDGTHIKRYQRDEVGNVTQDSFFGADGRPTRSLSWGAAIVRRLRDARGNEISTQLFDDQGRPTLGKGGFASMTTRFDAQDRELEYAYFGVDGSPVDVPDQGYSIARHTYDARGNLATTRYLDRDGARTLSNEGYFEVSYEYNARDKWVTQRHRDVAEQPVKVRDGSATTKRVFDGDRLVSYHLFDGAEQPTLGVDKWARGELSYDLNGKVGKWTLFDLDGKVVEVDECPGTVSPELKSEVMARRTGARACYQDYVNRDGHAWGKIGVRLRINQSGEVASASIDSDQIGDAALAGCVLKVFRRWYQHRPDASCVRIRIPLSFVLEK